ncbi:MAG: hypothetical protein EXR71_00720 [Myxococcales bacterium]|nr:hypothetical protein [Myxococcales bacterium]
MSLLLPLAAIALAAITQASPLRETWQALFGLPALYFAPGFALAIARNRRAGDTEPDLVRVLFETFWWSLPAAIMGWGLARMVEVAGWPQLGVSLLSALFGAWMARRSVSGGWMPPGRQAFGALIATVLLAGWFVRSAGDIARPLDRYWYIADAETRLPLVGRAPVAEGAWREAVAIGDPTDGVLRLRPGAGQTRLVGPTDGPFILAMHSFGGARLKGLGTRRLTVELSPTENPAEGPVWRYRGPGVAATWVDALGEGKSLLLNATEPETTTLYVIASQAGLWTLDGTGELRFRHYYQLLNMVEQLRWADDRWVTDVQPPLWTWVLAPAIVLTHGGQPTANVLLLVVLGAGALGGLLFLRRYAAEAPIAAWALPGAAVVVVGKLVLEPGSAGMPDTLYGVTIVAGLTSRAPLFGLAAQLLRYPGAAVVLMGTLLQRDRGAARRLVQVVGLAILASGLGGYATGALGGWMATVAWESGPEHWHGDFEPMVLLGRIPPFYWGWLWYGGFTPLLAALAWPPGTRVALGTALTYSLLLCTIDHSPTHYFVPLVLLSSMACGCTAAALARRWAGNLLATAGVVGLLHFCWSGDILG